MVKSSNKIISLALALILVVNVFAGVTLSSNAASSWIWEPYSAGYCGINSVTAADNASDGYTTFTVTGDDPYVYPGLGAGSLAVTASLGKLNADALKYGVIRYRTSTAAPGSILANAGAAVTSLGNYNGTGEWTDYTFASNLTGSVDWYRYDMFDGNAGTIDVAFIAYFDTDANRAAYLANRAMPVAHTTEEISVNGPYLQSIQSAGTYNIDNGTGAATDYTAFGTSWTAAGFAEGSSFIRLGYNNFVYLGDYDFSNVEKIIITYHTDGSLVAENSQRPGTKYSVGLAKTAASFGWADKEQDFSQAIAYGAISNGTPNGWPVPRSVTITDIDKSYSGGVWLTNYGCNTQMLVVVGITLVKVETPFDPSIEKVVDVEFSGSGIVDNLEGLFGDITGSATSYTKDSASNMYVANFDNSSSNSAAIKTAPIPKAALNIMAGTSTYETYFKMNPGTAEEAVFSSCETAGVGMFSPPNENSKYEFYIRDSAGYTVLTFDGAAVDTWYHVAVVVNNKTATMYINGEVVDTKTLASNIVWTNAGGFTPDTFVIGGDISYTGGVTEYAKDLSVGFVKVYTKALSASEVADAYEALTVKYNVSVGSVVNGTVTVTPNGAVEAGTKVTVTATPATDYVLDKIYVNGTAISGNTFNVTENAVVTGTFKKVQYAVSVGTVTNGTVTVTPNGTVNKGTEVTVTATPGEGYQLDKILVNGTAITGNKFTVAGASVVTATFKKIQYAVSVGTVANGTVTLSATGNVDYGTTVTITATPADGYTLDQILVNGTAITGNTFTVKSASVVTATFKALPPSVITYEVSVGTVSNGTVTATPLGTVEEGRTITVTATPATGYQLDAILVNGTAITGTTFELTEDAVITATFSLIPIVKYDVTIGTVTNGTVTATPNGEVEEGTTITVTATPATGYQLDAILVNGTAITGTTFELTGDVVITATFSLIPVTKYDVTVGTVENGTVIATPNGEVEEGTTVTVTATPAEGYALDKILVNGTAITGTTFEVTADSVVTATFKKTTTVAGNILIDKMNFNIWAQPYNTIIFDDTYAGPYRGPWQYTLVCRYNSVLGKYVVEEKYIPQANSNTSFSLAANQIIINAVGDSESYKACSSVWTATNVGSVLTLSGIDLVNQTVSEGAYAIVENGVTIPEDPNKGTEYPGNKIFDYYMNFDFIEADDEKIAASDVGGLGGEGYKYTGGTFNVSDKLVLTGWNATANGIDRYEYSFDRMNFTKIENASISARDDLTAANVPYATGHSTAGCVITIPASLFGTDGTYNLTVRAVDKQGNYYDIFSSVINADVPEGTVPTPDDQQPGTSTPGDQDGQEDNVGTDDAMAFTVVGLMAMVAMVAVVLKRKKEY